MNIYEQEFIGKWSKCNYVLETPYELEKKSFCRPLFNGMVADVENILPHGTISKLDVLAEYSQRFGEDDGLLSVTYQPWLTGEAFLRPEFFDAITTIWIANYTKLIKEEDRRFNKTKRQRKFQMALRFYCFNYVTWPSEKDALYFEGKIEERFTRDEWMYSKTDEVQEARLLFAFEMMHYYGLEYFKPELLSEESRKI